MPLPHGFRPMLAGKVDVGALRYPLYGSVKLDGVRAIIVDGIVTSRSLKPIPNDWVQALFGKPEFNGLDGELIVGPPNHPNVYTHTVSGVMAVDGKPTAQYLVFDHYEDCRHTYEHRWGRMAKVLKDGPQGLGVLAVPQVKITDGIQLNQYEEESIAIGYEGIMLRTPSGAYKYGRSTTSQGWLLKIKRFQDAEATVLGFEELMHNANEATTNALGKSERSSHKENKVPMGILGALIVKDVKSGVEFNIGTGFNDQDRTSIWAARDKVQGATVKYRFQPAGVLDKPRFPVFVGFRDERDQ